MEPQQEELMKIKIRPTVLIIAVGLVAALIVAIVKGYMETISVIAVALTGALTKLVESEEVTAKGGDDD